MLGRKQRKYGKKKILMETGGKTGYVLGYIFLYRSYWRDCVCFTKGVCGKNDGSPMLFSSYEEAYNYVKTQEYHTNFY